MPAGIDLRTGVDHAIVEDQPRSTKFGTFLGNLVEYCPVETRIRDVLDNQSAHTSKETMARSLPTGGASGSSSG